MSYLFAVVVWFAVGFTTAVSLYGKKIDRMSDVANFYKKEYFKLVRERGECD